MSGQSAAYTLASPIRPRRRARAGEALLADALDREARAPLGRIAVVVRLSRLPPPGARPYHRRIARALLEDCAQRHGGQVFRLAGGDLVLLAPPVEVGMPASGALALPALLVRLLQPEGDTSPGAEEPIAEAIHLVAGHARLHALLDAAPPDDDTAPDDDTPDDPPDDAPHAPPGAASAGEAPDRRTRPRNIFAGRQPKPPSVEASTMAVATLAALPTGDIAALLQLQTAAHLPARFAPPATPLRAVHRALRIVPALLAAHLAAADRRTSLPGAAPAGLPAERLGGLPADPWLRQHLAQGLAAALVTLLRQSWGSATPLDATPRRGMPTMLIALPPAVVNSPGFAAFAALFPRPELAANSAGTLPPAMLSVAISMAEASADPTGFAAARTRLHDAGMALVLDGISHHALLLARPEALGPDLVALAWSSALPRLTEERRDAIAAAVQRIGPARVLLTEADTEAALLWGRAAGIQLFQGRHAEAMLAATRLMMCSGARGGAGPDGTMLPPCQLRSCAERATATTAAGRTGCTNPRLLDQGVPNPVHAVATTLTATTLPATAPGGSFA